MRAGDMVISGSGKLKVASMARAAEGVKLPLNPYMFPSPNPKLEGLEKPEGEGRPNVEENLRLEKVGDIGASDVADMADDDAAAPVE